MTDTNSTQTTGSNTPPPPPPPIPQEYETNMWSQELANGQSEAMLTFLFGLIASMISFVEKQEESEDSSAQASPKTNQPNVAPSDPGYDANAQLNNLLLLSESDSRELVTTRGEKHDTSTTEVGSDDEKQKEIFQKKDYLAKKLQEANFKKDSGEASYININYLAI